MLGVRGRNLSKKKSPKKRFFERIKNILKIDEFF